MRAMMLLSMLVPLAGCSESAEQPPAAPLVRTFVIGNDGARAEGGALTGTVAARVESTLAFREGGRIVERRVDNGTQVRAGALIARIDPADLGENLAAARAQALAAARGVDAARAAAERTAADVRRLDGLAEAGAISRSAYDAAVEAQRAAGARLSAAKADATAASASARLQDNRRGYSALRADADGVVTAVLAQPGEVVAVGSPVVRLAHDGPREVVVEVPEQQRGAIPRTAAGRLYGGGEFQVVLRELAAAADPVTRTYRARYRIVGPQPPLGATVTLHMPGDTAATVTSVPIAAVTERGGGAGVWVLGRDNKVGWQRVAVAGMDGERAMVGGLRPGTRIVALGAHLLQPGQAVRVSPALAAR